MGRTFSEASKKIINHRKCKYNACNWKDIDIVKSTFTIDELKTTLKNTKYGKVWGLNNILKKSGELMISMIAYYNCVMQYNLETQ